LDVETGALILFTRFFEGIVARDLEEGFPFLIMVTSRSDSFSAAVTIPELLASPMSEGGTRSVDIDWMVDREPKLRSVDNGKFSTR
jgi:hypothetical protein